MTTGPLFRIMEEWRDACRRRKLRSISRIADSQLRSMSPEVRSISGVSDT